MEAYKRLLKNNAEWAAAQLKEDPDYFQRLVNLQTPEI
jgi:carbonic anhydrase